MIEHLISFQEAELMTGIPKYDLINIRDLEVREFNGKLHLTFSSVVRLVDEQ